MRARGDLSVANGESSFDYMFISVGERRKQWVANGDELLKPRESE